VSSRRSMSYYASILFRISRQVNARSGGPANRRRGLPLAAELSCASLNPPLSRSPAGGSAVRGLKR
jgi:hypothetical protein